jgi:hypothetical protein
VGQQRLPVRKIREVLRLKAAGFSDRQIGVATVAYRDECRGRRRYWAYARPAALPDGAVRHPAGRVTAEDATSAARAPNRAATSVRLASSDHQSCSKIELVQSMNART